MLLSALTISTNSLAESSLIDSDQDGVPNHLDKCPAGAREVRVDEHGCYDFGRSGQTELKVGFAFDSADIAHQHRSQLENIAAYLKAHPSKNLSVEGHADGLGEETYNLNLSAMRAKAVRDVLVNDYGVPAEKLRIVAHGEAKAIASNDTADGRKRNRRVMGVLSQQALATSD